MSSGFETALKTLRTELERAEALRVTNLGILGEVLGQMGAWDAATAAARKFLRDAETLR